MNKLMAIVVGIVCGAFVATAADREQFSVGELTLGGTKITATAAQINSLVTGSTVGVTTADTIKARITTCRRLAASMRYVTWELGDMGTW